MNESRRSSTVQLLAEPAAERLDSARLERELELVASTLAPADGHDLRPRLISAADLVLRLRPFIGLN